MYLGIDLGTSNSAIASYDNGKVQIHKAPGGRDVLPSAVYVGKHGSRFYGSQAYKHLITSPDNVAVGFKRFLGYSWTKAFDGTDVTKDAVECSADILKALIKLVDETGQSASGAVITVPARFNPMQIDATSRAAEMAGIEKFTLLEEPVAAAMDFVAGGEAKDGRFLIYDIGGGTFDLAIVEIRNGRVDVIQHEGRDSLGGRNFDRTIFNEVVLPWMREEFTLPDGFQTDKYKTVREKILQGVEDAKIGLSDTGEQAIDVSHDLLRISDKKGVDIYVSIPFTRKEYEALIRDQLDDTLELSHKIIKDAGYRSSDMDGMILVGGPCMTPAIKEGIPRELGISANLSLDPLTAVARGAAVYGEAVDWSNPALPKKKSQVHVRGKGDLKIRYDYESRTVQDSARIHIDPDESIVNDGYKIQIESNKGWTSGEIDLGCDALLDLPLDKGDNHFRALVFSSTGALVQDATTEIVITRTLAKVGPFKLPFNLAAEVIDDDDEAKTTLDTFAEKGVAVPCAGVTLRPYRSRKTLSKPGDSMEIKLYLQPDKANAVLDEPNHHIGSILINRSALKGDIRKGDELHIHWSVNERKGIKCSAEIGKVGELILGTLIDGDVYSSAAGHVTLEGAAGKCLISDVIKRARQELLEVRDLAGVMPAELTKVNREVDEQESAAQGTTDEEGRLIIRDKIRHICQQIAAYRHDPKNTGVFLGAQIDREVAFFDRNSRENVDEKTCADFDKFVQRARDVLEGDNPDYSVAEHYIKEFIEVGRQAYWSQPKNIMARFRHYKGRRHAAIDVDEHERLVRQGEDAVDNGAFDDLRRILPKLGQNQRKDDRGSGNVPNRTSDISR